MNKLRIFVDLATTPEVLAILREGTRGHDLVFPEKPVTSVLAKAEADPQFPSADIAFGQPDIQAIRDSERLRWIHISTSGITRYDNPEFRSLMAGRGIPVSNSASVYQEACAQHTLGFILAQARSLPLALTTRTANGSPAWHALRASCVPLKGQTVLILGYGAIGRRLVELLSPLGMKVIAFRRHPRGDETVPVVGPDSLDAAMGSADHIINILPDSIETRGYFNAARFSTAKPGSVFYNIGRGSTVDQTALADALSSRQISAAWLDVTNPEPLPDSHPLWLQPNCHITPHVAGGHTNETLTLVHHFVDNFARFTRGEPLKDRVM